MAQMQDVGKIGKRRRRMSRRSIIALGFLVTLVITLLWIASGTDILPTLWGITPTNLATSISIIVVAFAAFFAFIPTIPEEQKGFLDTFSVSAC